MIREKVKCDWIITYDDAPEITHIYDGYNLKRYNLNYSVYEKKRASEVIIFRNETMIPTCKELEAVGCTINLY